MMTRFEEVIARTATALKLPYETVFEHIMEMALRTQNRLEAPNTMEVDLLGVGTLEIRYGKALRKQQELKNRMAFTERHRTSGVISPERMARYESKMEGYAELLAHLEEVCEQKGDIRDAGGRFAYYKAGKIDGDLDEHEPYFEKYSATGVKYVLPKKLMKIEDGPYYRKHIRRGRPSKSKPT